MSDWENKINALVLALKCLQLADDNGDDDEEEEDNARMSLEGKDYLALVIAALETILLPFVVVIVVLVVLLVLVR